MSKGEPCVQAINFYYGIVILSKEGELMKTCFICRTTEHQGEIIKSYGEFGHSYCIEDAIADAKDQEREYREQMSHHGEYERDYQRGYTRACLYCGEGASPGTEFCSTSCVSKFSDGDWD